MSQLVESIRKAALQRANEMIGQPLAAFQAKFCLNGWSVRERPEPSRMDAINPDRCRLNVLVTDGVVTKICGLY